MEFPTRSIKLKKRKTRKCLNEMRKRSRTNLTDAQANENKKSILESYSNITAERLTLSIFSKAVRSETITRPALAEIRHESNLKLDNILKGSKIEYYTNIAKETKPIKKTPESNKKVLESYSKTINFTNLNSSDDNSFVNILEDKSISIQSIKTIETDTNETISTLNSSSTTSEVNTYEMYKEFLNELPQYISESVPTLINKNVIKKRKAVLQSLYVRKCRRENANNILNSIQNRIQKNNNNSSYHPATNEIKSESIVQKPMDYIRMGYMRSDNLPYKNRTPSPDLTDVSFSSLPHFSPTSISFEDTPEYKFFPHKLNQ